MKMIDMKRDIKKSKVSEVNTISSDQPKYPYGLSIRLENESLDKLGMELDDFEIGETMTLQIEAKVVSMSFDAGEKNKSSRCELQITKIGKPDGGMSKKSILKGHPADGAK